MCVQQVLMADPIFFLLAGPASCCFFLMDLTWFSLRGRVPVLSTPQTPPASFIRHLKWSSLWSILLSLLFNRLFCASFGSYVRHFGRCTVTMLFYSELGRFAVKLIVEKYKSETLINVLSIFDRHNGLVVPLKRGTRVCSFPDNKVTICSDLELFPARLRFNPHL